ncbi:PQQ-dependent sugar dehydrogenase [Dyadobacter pollutisoli]|uniref:PQQ-dependent sugar dehydrogenase n=1 Tax=Dyadobacter pollutisoli TaxID=2910158 RepID=A0A9E8NJY0_9BACT|nr:PQQ-dependent sugar dehydrogenase [Dyadobacter pollutisoli]WAC15384.1 PQQ-dependent sugar dehydrogenase [Dyadobacter pollutisoli]
MKPISRKLVVLALLLIACKSSTREGIGPVADESVKVTEAFPQLTFQSPVDLTHANDGSNRLFVLEQEGTIRVFDNNSSTATSQEFLNIKSKVSYGGEAGLLGLTFHPDYKNNGYFFLNYTRKTGGKLETAIVRYKVSASNKNQADAASETVLFTFDQPFDNHNGGAVKFGKDGYLYVSTGDGGSWGDPSNNGQNKSAFLGKILRVDVNSTEKGNYGIPKDNPFAGNKEGFREEIYAYGLRNPWRISFDDATNTLWAGDVGQNAREEIDIIVKGGNYGWRRKESVDCYNPKKDCGESGLIDPVLDMPQSKGEHSITGGFVYRGNNVPALRGKYIFGDYVSGRVFALETKDGKAVKNTILAEGVGQISAFGTDAANELYICNHGTGKILKLVRK